MRAATLGVLVAVVVIACLPPAGTLFKTTIAQPDGAYPLPVTLGDETGLVTAIESANGDAAVGLGEPIVRPDLDDPRAVIVTFITGLCDDDATVSFQRAGAAFVLHMAVHEGIRLDPCPAAAAIRGFRLRFAEPVPANLIAATGTR
jgi:hypothetical protein